MTIVVPGRPERPIVVEGEASPDITVQGGRGLPPGGTAGQALIKATGSNFAVEWITLPTPPTITVGTTAPSSPAVGDIWIDTN